MEQIKSWYDNLLHCAASVTCAPLVIILAVVFTACMAVMVALGIAAISIMFFVDYFYKLFVNH
jgi:hypothetical protein